MEDDNVINAKHEFWKASIKTEIQREITKEELDDLHNIYGQAPNVVELEEKK